MRRAYLFAFLLSWPAVAHAHDVGLSRGEWALRDGRLEAHLVFSAKEVDRDGARAVADRIDAKGCTRSSVDVLAEEDDGVGLSIAWTCPPGAVDVDLLFLDDVPYGHRHVAQLVSTAGAGVAIAFRDAKSFRVDPLASKARRSFAGLFVMGLEHIVTGWDHLLFLLALVLVGGRFKSLVAVVTAFTIGHSVSLAIATLGIWQPSTRLVEPAIALSIAYVGFENFLVDDASKRWRITLPFGLVHGFGFAGALAQIHLPRPQIPAALVAFNLGVEAGQIAVLALVLPLVLAFRRRAGLRGVRALSAVVIALGVVLFAERVT